MGCLAPWAFGAVDAWAQFDLSLGVVLLATLGLLLGGRPGVIRRLTCGPSLALGGLALLALLQARPLPNELLERVAPGVVSLRRGLVPAVAGRVRGDQGPPVAPPSATISQDPDATRGTAWQLVLAWVLFQVVLNLGGGGSALRRFGLATAINAALLALYAIVQALTWDGMILGVRPSPLLDPWSTGGPFVCHNHLAAYLNVGLGFALALLLAPRTGSESGSGQREHRRRSRSEGRSRSDRVAGEHAHGASRRRSHSARRSRDDWSDHKPRSFGPWPAYLAAMILAGVIASHSRGGFLAMVAALGVLVLLQGRGMARAWAGLALVGALGSLFLVALGSASPLRRLATILDPSSTGYGARFEIWTTALRAWRAHPTWGTGLGCFADATGAYFPRDRGVFFSHAENEYVQVLVEGGLIGLGLTLMGLIATARLAWRARAATARADDRAAVLGGLFGASALAVQCLSDFPMHIPGVAITAIILAGYLVRLGLSEEEPRTEKRAEIGILSRVSCLVSRVSCLGLALIAAVHSSGLARAESHVLAVGLPTPGALVPSAMRGDLGRDVLERRRAALEAALRDRPDWAEGYARLGETWLELYAQTAREWLERAEAEVPADRGSLADCLWLHGVVHASNADRGAAADGLLEHEPIRLDLVPAARCFQEARRCCPVLALPHARLACLDYLLDGREPSTAHIDRALRQAGSDGRLVATISRLAYQAGASEDFVARGWRRALEAGGDWDRIADAVAAELSPDLILDRVLPPGGRFPLRFADRVFGAPEHRAIRERFLHAALERLPAEPDLGPTERLWTEAQIRARLDEREQALHQMEAALHAEPLHGDWWAEAISWRLAWGDAAGAHRRALAATAIHPRHDGLRRALRASVEALAHGAEPPGDAGVGREATR